MTDETPLKTETPVVVLNTHHSGLGIARCLGPRGIRVIGLTHVPEFCGNRSRWLEYRASADSATEPDRLLDQLRAIAGELGTRAVLFPTRDHDVSFICRFWGALNELFLLPSGGPSVLLGVMNKASLHEAARAIGVTIPEGVTIRHPHDVTLARPLPFPCICKPVLGNQWRKPGIWEAVGRRKAVKVESYDDFAAFYERISHLDPQVIVQQWVEGNDADLLIFASYCTSDHEVAGSFTARKLLQLPPQIGTGVIVEAAPIDGLEQPARELLRALRYRGISEMEFKRDRHDGRLYLIEVNPRHWDQHRLGAVVGVDVSEMAYRDATGQAQRPMFQRARAVRWIAERELAEHSARALLGRAPLGDLAKVFGAPRTWSVYDRTDPAPFWALLGFGGDLQSRNVA